MGELANYSIETDQLVWLAFKDGHSLRVPFGLLPRYLTPRDLQKVRRAMKLRRDFFRHNMPTALLAFLAVGLVMLVAAGGQLLALLGRRTTLGSPAPHTEIVRNVNSPASSPSPAPLPATGPVVTVVRHRTAARSKPMPTLPPVSLSAVVGTEAVLVTPIPTVPVPSPEPSPSPSPAPSPSPTPDATEPPAGQVLGDSTGPGDGSEAPTK
jgi:hypothetical protein